jgi:NADPH:quinone reductase-like Zn-dependent oxidoreductase
VESVGPAVTRFRPGDAVYAMLPSTAGGGYAEYAAVDESGVAPSPSGLSLAEAAAVPLVALQALRDKANLGTDDHVLINGASGGVGTFAVQIAKVIGARVTATSSGHNIQLVRGLGADEVIDYTRQDMTAGDTSYDVVFDAVNVLSVRRSRRVLRKDGVFVTVNPLIGMLSPGWLARFRGGRRTESVFVQPSGADLETIAGWVSSGRVRPVVARSYPLSDAAAAHRYSESKRVRGKFVLGVDERLAVAGSGLA